MIKPGMIVDIYFKSAFYNNVKSVVILSNENEELYYQCKFSNKYASYDSISQVSIYIKPSLSNIKVII